MAQLLLPPIAESLLVQFRSLAKARVEAAAPHVRPRPAAGRPGGGDHAQLAVGPAVTPARAPQDRGEAAVDAAAGALYERVLDGLRLVARHAATGLLDALLQWRKENLNLAARSGAELLILRKRVCAAPGPPRPPARPPRPRLLADGAAAQLAVETVFLEAGGRLVGRGGGGLSERQADALERLAFDWILNAEKYVEPKFAELGRARDRVAQLCGMLLGSLSATRLGPVSARFFQARARGRPRPPAASLWPAPGFV